MATDEELDRIALRLRLGGLLEVWTRARGLRPRALFHFSPGPGSEGQVGIEISPAHDAGHLLVSLLSANGKALVREFSLKELERDGDGIVGAVLDAAYDRIAEAG